MWFWDAINPGPEPGAAIDEILGVEVPVADPASMNSLWHRLLGLGVPVTTDEVDLGGAFVRFVPGGPSAAAAATDPGLPGISFRLV